MLMKKTTNRSLSWWWGGKLYYECSWRNTMSDMIYESAAVILPLTAVILPLTWYDETRYSEFVIICTVNDKHGGFYHEKRKEKYRIPWIQQQACVRLIASPCRRGAGYIAYLRRKVYGQSYNISYGVLYQLLRRKHKQKDKIEAVGRTRKSVSDQNDIFKHRASLYTDVSDRGTVHSELGLENDLARRKPCDGNTFYSFLFRAWQVDAGARNGVHYNNGKRIYFRIGPGRIISCGRQPYKDRFRDMDAFLRKADKSLYQCAENRYR